jgi:hypothetical protein
MEQTMISKRTNKLAISSISLGIISLVMQLLLFITLLNLDYEFKMFVDIYIIPVLLIILIITAPLALIFGIIALFRIQHSHNIEGKRFAITGIICGSEFVLIVILARVFWESLISYE